MKLSSLSIAVKGILLSSIGLANFAYSQTTDEENMPTADLGTIVVTASADASKEGLMPEFEGGQVATGSRIGILGNKENLDTPISTTAYTNAYINNQQAQSVGDVLKNDPTVQVARGFGNLQESYIIRGFVTNSDDTMMNGLYGILPRQYIASELFERVEVQRGANSFLNGMAPGGSNKGGTINLLPKRAGNEPTRNLTVSTVDGENAKIALDVGQRFGAEQAFGVRANVAYQDGNTAIDDEESKLGLAALGLDYKNDKVRLSADIGYQNNELSQTRTNVTLSGVDTVPTAPDGKTNWAEPWTFSDENDVFATFRGEYDIKDNITGFAAYGFRHGEEENSLANLTVTDADGTGTNYRFDNTREDDVNTAELGLRGNFQTKAVSHDWVISGNWFNLDKKAAYTFDSQNSLDNNLYTPIHHARPDFSATAISGNTLSDPQTIGKTTLSSIAITDTLGFMDDKLQATFGGRYQHIKDESFSYNTQAKDASYDEGEFTPAFGVTYRFDPSWSVYANYMESLSKGEVAPVTTTIDNVTTPVTNAGQALSPYVTKQTEAGIKYDDGLVGAGLSVFNIDKPRYTMVDTTFEERGKNVHQGIELNVYGSPAANIRVLGGMSYLDTEQQDTENSATEGKQVIGVPKLQQSLGVEYDVEKVEGLTLTGDIIHTGKRYANDANTLEVDSYTTLDIGGRYTTQWANTPVTLKAMVTNVTDEKYWASVGGYENSAGNNGSGYLNAGDPRTFKLAATFEF